MTQARLIQALQDGPMTSAEIAESTGMSKETVLSTAKKLRYKGDLITEQVKVGRYWVAKYTLTKPDPKTVDKTIICGIQTYGIFTPAEYRIMNAQARALYGNGQPFTTYSKAVPNENDR
jgi:biotin operon repressor